MLKVQIYVNRMVLKQLLPDRLANFLRYPLVVPASRAPQVPFRVISKKLFQDSLPFNPVNNSK